MIVLVINCGSSSLKYQLYDMPSLRVLARGLVEKIGDEGSVMTHRRGDGKISVVRPIPTHREAARLVLDTLICREQGVLGDVREIGAVGHRVVHGGEAYSGSVRIDPQVIEVIEGMSELAPLHNPPNLMGIHAVQAVLPGVPMAAVFDTAYHQTIPKKAYLYPLPYEYYEKYRIRKYGFHGTSHQYVARRAAELLGRPANAVNLIVCHLGNGASITAVRNGESIDTTMGFTPLAGLMMGTRTGDIDPSVPLYLLRTAPGLVWNLHDGDSSAAPSLPRKESESGSLDKLNDLLNKESGLKGVSGASNDMRELQAIVDREGPSSRAALAIDMFVYRVKCFVGMYFAVLGRVDAVIFTAGIGENDRMVRGLALADLRESLGIEVDAEKNDSAKGGFEGDISTEASRVRVLVVPTDEEGFIASEAYRLCGVSSGRAPEF